MRKPKDKARVERPMPYVRDSFWRGREFTSVEQMQQAALAWCTDVAGARSCRPLGGAAPLTVFNAVEASELKPLPRQRFTLATWSRASVGPDIHVKVGRCLYSVPWRFIGQKIDARSTFTMVQIFAAGQLIATHPAKSAGKQTELGHYPPEKTAFAMRTPTWCRTQAEQIGPHAVAVIAELLAVNALFRLRAAQGVLRLVDKYGPARLEAACGMALIVGDPSYRTVKGILVAGAESDPLPPASGDGGAAAFLHGPQQLFGNVIALSAITSDASNASGHEPGQSGAGVSA